MSRYTTPLPNGRTVAYGYDRPLQEYFISEYYSKEEMLNKDADSDCVYCISSHTTLVPHPNSPEKMQYANSELLEILESYGDAIPEQHIVALTLDLPF
jgi:hypothetical protein